MHARPSFLLCGRRAFSRAPGRGHRIQAPLSARDLLARAGGWEWAENWSEEMTEMQKKAVKIRRKVPWDNTCPEVLEIKRERKHFLQKQWEERKNR